MKRSIAFVSLFLMFAFYGNGQDLVNIANKFIGSLEAKQKEIALFPFDIEERYTFYFVPRNDRKGIEMNEMNAQQKKAALDLLKSCLSLQGFDKASQIMEMEVLLKAIEKRKEGDHYRDPGKYFISIFGIPGEKNIWGWRFEGHHLSFHFSTKNNQLVAGTPGFMGSNPGIVLEGPEKGKQILKEETDLGFAMLNTLSKDALQKALIDNIAPNDILTVNHRKAMLENSVGIPFAEMTKSQQQQLLQLINLYIHRYTKLFADDMLKEIQKAGLENLRFAWAGSMIPGIGKAYYYRIQGPTIIIELDNSQNNANHVHTVVRDLLHDFGGDMLLEHYRKTSHQ